MDRALAAAAAARPPPEQPAGRRLAAQIGVVVAIVVLVLGATVALEARVARAIEDLRDMALEATEQAAGADALHDALTEAEAGQRGFLLTQQPRYLDQYAGALGRIDRATVGLDRVGERAPWLRGDAAALVADARALRAAMERAMELVRAGDREAALRIVAEDGADVTMSATLGRAVGIVAHANAVRDDRLALVRVRERQAAVGIVVVSAFGLILLGLAASTLLGGHARLTRSEQALRLQSARLEATVANLRDGVAVFDADDRLVLWNANFFAATGLPESLARPGTRYARFAEAGENWPARPLSLPRPLNVPRETHVTLDRRSIDLWRAAMPDGGQMIAAIDATERVNADARARQASKLEALGQLTGGVAHDFNNLLQVVSSNLEMVRKLFPPVGAGRAQLSAALSGVDRAAQLTRRLLAFARRQPLAPATLDPWHLLNGMDDMLRRTLGETIEVSMRIDPDIWAIRADPNLVENAILNLAINARDAMPQGGRLTIEATNAVIDAAAGRRTDVEPGEYVRFAVSDTGHGMAAETLARATEPFFTTKPDGHGTGLGLPMVFGFARQSGGNFEIESTPGFGTRTSLLLPRSRAVPETPRPAGPPDERENRADGELVLAVEDDEAVRAAAVEALESLGYRVVAAANADAAQRLLREGLRPDILFTDIVMPGRLNAHTLVEEARALHPGMAVVFTSGYADKAGGAAESHDAALPLLHKPWRIGELSRELHAAIQASRRQAGGAAPKRAMLVEDDAMVRMVTADLLSELGYEVAEFGTGGAALLALPDSRTDLLVTDIGLPDMNGLDVAQQALKLAPDLAIVIASGARNEARDGFTFLEKPYDAARLRRAVGLAMQAAA